MPRASCSTFSNLRKPLDILYCVGYYRLINKLTAKEKTNDRHPRDIHRRERTRAPIHRGNPRPRRRGQLMPSIDRSEVSRSLAKAIAYQNVDKPEEAEAWARKLVQQLKLANILKD